MRVVILGLGLIGGSLALVWKKRRPDIHITAYDRADVLEKARENGIVDAISLSPEKAVSEADVVVLALPLSPMLHTLGHISEYLAPGTIVTDVGSVKSPIMDHALEVLPKDVLFVGGHPMAGSEKGGIENADAFLFENATFVLCPPAAIGEDDLVRQYPDFIQLIEDSGGRLLFLNAVRHDRIAAAVSHLPQLLAVALMNYVATLHEEDDAFLRLAAGGFRDMTRIASSPFSMWKHILVANEGHILDTLAGFSRTLQTVRNRVAEENLDQLDSQFQEASRVRDTIPRDSKGFLHPLSDIYVYAEDHPGVLYHITRTLYEAELNIKDIELLKIREGTGGAFRMSFSDEPTAEEAIVVLENAGCVARRI